MLVKPLDVIVKRKHALDTQRFKLMDVNYDKTLLVADPTTFNGFRKLSSEEYIHTNHVFRDKDGKLIKS